MSAVVLVVWIRLAVVAEIRVVANGTLVADALDVVVLILAEWSVAVDAHMTGTVLTRHRNWIEDGSEAMKWVDEAGILDAFRAVIPIWAIEALVANTEDWL
jgi:hypothetical protein